MGSKPRCAVAGLSHESNSFSTLRAGEDEFHVWRGAEMLRGGPALTEAIEWIPLLQAGARPYGLVERHTYERMRDEILDGLAAAMPLEGVLLRLHGAMDVEGLGDGETDLVRAIRDLVGSDPLLVGSLDLHANLAPEVADLTDCLTAYREAPHRDAAATWERATRHMSECLLGGRRPVQALVKLPMLLPGEWAVTDCEPAHSLYASLASLDDAAGVVDSSILIGCAWTDSEHTSVSALVVAEDREVARTHAEELAGELWDRREEFGPESETLEPVAAIEAALADPAGGVLLSDTGDNPGAGAAGDLPIMLRLLLEAGAEEVLVGGLRDDDSVERCLAAGVGCRVALQAGGKLDRVNAEPLEVEAVVERLVAERWAVVRVGGVTLVLSRGPIDSGLHAITREMGMDPLAYRAVVVKAGFLSSPARELARRSIWALTPGWTDLRLERLPYRRLRRPIWPLDPEARWEG